MKRRDVQIRENSPLARIAAGRLGTDNVAMVIGHTIHLYGVSRSRFLARESWVCHELQHVAQYERHGIAGFVLRYLWESLRRGYHANRFEAEARAAESDRTLLDRYRIAARKDKEKD